MAFVEVDTIPGQAKDFPLPHTGKQIDNVNRFERVPAYGFHECSNLIIFQRVQYLPDGSGEYAPNILP